MTAQIGSKNRLDLALDELALYYGILRKDAFMAHLMRDVESDSDVGFQPPDPSLQDLAISSLMDIVDGGLFINEYLDQLLQADQNSGDKDVNAGEAGVQTFRDEINKSLCITMDIEQGALPESGQNATQSPGYHSFKNGYRGQGDGNIENDTAEASGFDLDFGLKSSEWLNQTPNDPSSAHPNLGVIQIFPPKFDPCNRNTDALAFFLAGIPTLEMSRSVPYIDIHLISEGSAVTLFPDSDSKYINTGQPNLTSFLYGRHEVSEENAADWGIASGQFADFLGAKDDEGNPLDDGHQVSGMEMFTAPQTLVNADESHKEMGVNFDTSIRSTPVIDRFRPFASLTSLSFSVTPSVGMFSHKKGKLAVTLHDRSRLHEIAPLVKPSLYGKTKLKITYGWSHPDGTADSPNKIGQFIDALKTKEFYQVVNSSYSFTAEGQVEIQCDLSMLGQQGLNTTQVYLGEDLVESGEAISELTDAISVVSRKLKKQGEGVSDLEGFNFLEAVSSSRSAVSLSEDHMKELKAFMAANPPDGELQELGSLRDLLTTLYGSDGSGTEGSLKVYTTGIADIIGRKVEALKTRSDPFFRPVKLHDEGGASINWKHRPDGGRVASWVSLGKILSLFVGVPLAKSGQFDEIQMLYFGFNDKASFMKDFNISQFPIYMPGAEGFEDLLTEELEKNPKMTVQAFMGFMNKYFLSDMGQGAYGMQKIYSHRDPEDKSKRVVSSTYRKGGAEGEIKDTEVLAAKQRALQAAYGGPETGDSLTFRKPVIQMRMETVPHVTKPGKSILRIFITDQVQSSHTAPFQLLNAARNSTMGLINVESKAIISTDDDADKMSTDHAERYLQLIADAADEDKGNLLEPFPAQAGTDMSGLAVDDIKGKSFKLKGGIGALKGYLRSVLPYFRYGTGTSGVMSAQLQSMQNSALASVNMLRTGGENAPSGYQDTGVPLRISPMELSMECMGFPLACVGQQIFCDFDTGTTADNIYSITGIDHSIKQGEFTTSLKMVNMPDAYGQYETMFDKIAEALKVIGDADPEGSA